MKLWWRDFWRGFSDDDYAMALAKVQAGAPPGGMIPMTPREMRAFRAHVVAESTRQCQTSGLV